MKRIKKHIAILVMAIISLQYLFPSMQSFADKTANVDVSVQASPVIDIVLAKSKTKVDVSSFEDDLKKELINQNISPDRIKINAVEAVEANIQESFDWKKDVSSKIGSIQITNNGQDIVMKGNNKNPGKNAIWIIPDKEQEQEIKFDYSVDFGDSFNAAGMLLRVKQEGNTLKGYMLSLNKSGKTWYKTAGNKYGAIWKFTYNIGTNTSNMTKTFVQGLDINTSGTLNIKSTDTKIIISGGGLKSTLEYVMDTEYGHGFGFFSDHYSHNCSKIGAFTLGNISLTTTTVKKFEEVLSNPEWRENSLRFLVNVDDNENEELKNKASLASLQTNLINEQINTVFWGTNKNQVQLNEIVQASGNGMFTDNTDYEEAIKSTVQYIKTKIEDTPSSQYAIIGEEVNLKVTPESAKTDTIDLNYPLGKWRVNHDYEYFENNLGEFINNGRYMSDLTLSFDKTGRYEIFYENESIPSKYIYVHRRPVANFNITTIGKNVNLTSNSYDLDCYSNNKGIAEEEWKYRKIEDTEWTSGKIDTIEQDEVYVVQLRVKDFQETWSNPTTRYVTCSDANIESTPEAYFIVKNTTVSKYENVEIENTSYDPAGLSIIDELWTIKDEKNNVLYKGRSLPRDYTSYEEGTYVINLVVTNELGKNSKEFSRKIQIVGDTIAPEVTASKGNCNWTNKPVEVKLTFSDKGGSGVRRI